MQLLDNKKIGVRVYNEWADLLQVANWYTMTFVELYTEYDPTFGKFELRAALLGFVIHIDICVAEPNARGKMIIDRVNDLMPKK